MQYTNTTAARLEDLPRRQSLPTDRVSTMSISSRVSSIAALTLGSLISSTHAAVAQTSAPQPRAWELRVTSGALVPTGAQRSVLKDAQMTAAQMSWVVTPSVAFTGTFAWARSRDVGAVGAPKLDVFTSDVGVEARPVHWFAGRAMTLSPFVGVGAGARSYNYRKLDVDATHNVAAYGAVGGELGIGRVGLRLEARNYATGFRPLVGAGRSDMRNDVVAMAALSFRRKSDR